MKTQTPIKNRRSTKRIQNEFYHLLVSLKRDIDDDFRATDDPCDDKPGMQVTFACDDDVTTWNYQTGDNSYSGGCYSLPHWGVVSLYRNSNCKLLAADAMSEILDGVYQSQP